MVKSNVNVVVTEPKKLSEFEIHAYLWSALRDIGINARGEVNAPYATWQVAGKERRAKCRFDIAIFYKGILTGIVEVKDSDYTDARMSAWRKTRQGHRYHQFGVPVAIVFGKAHAEKFIETTKKTGAICWDQFGFSLTEV